MILRGISISVFKITFKKHLIIFKNIINIICVYKIIFLIFFNVKIVKYMSMLLSRKVIE